MKSHFTTVALSGLFLMVLGSSVWAADLGPYQPYSPPPPPPPVSYEQPSIWEGAYVGVNGGYDWSNSNLGEPDGAFGGGQIGYYWQRGRFVFGVEGDMQGGDINGSTFGPFGAARSDIDWFSTVRGRAGIAQGPFLLYATGGLAIADITNDAVVGLDSFHESDVKTGYAVGGGLEWAFARNLSLKAEYLYLGFGDDTISNGPAAIRVNNDQQVVRVGLNYKF